MVIWKIINWPAMIKSYSSTKHQHRTSNITFSMDTSDAISFDYSTDNRSSWEKVVHTAVRNCLLVIVNEAIRQLYMLTHVSSEIETYKKTNIEYQDMKKRYGGTTENYNAVRLDGEYTDGHKIHKELATILCLLESVNTETKHYGTFTLFNQYMDNLIKMQNDERNLMKELEQKIIIFNCIKKAQNKEKEMSSAVIATYNHTIKDTWRKYQEQTEYSATEINYVKKWERSRYEQNYLQLIQTETNYLNTFTRMRTDMDLEQRCHDELKLFIFESYQDIMDEIQIWMDRYETAMESLESDIYNKKMDMERLMDKYESLKIEYEERTNKIEEWTVLRKKREEEEMLLADQIWAASIIQAWWRGVMVRRHLGPYKKHKKGKRGKAAKTKK